MGDSLPLAPMNRRTKFDAAGFILTGEIRNRTNRKALTDISRCRSAPPGVLHSFIRLLFESGRIS